MLKRILHLPRKLLSEAKHRISPTVDSFYPRVSGIIHVGANTGQERYDYAWHGLSVAWIEPIPAVFETLLENVKPFESQRAFCCLLTDQDGQTYDFKIASNGAQSSSIFELDQHRDIWPDVVFESSIQLQSTTLDRLIEREGLDIGRFDALVMDTQGSELLVLKGAKRNLPRFRYIKTEAADFQAYAGCCQDVEIADFLRPYGFREVARTRQASRPGGGSYFEILYRR